jgi:hypothetical protein
MKEPQPVSIEQLAQTNADLAAQVSLQTNVCAYFKKVHADALAECKVLRARVAELEAGRQQTDEEMLASISGKVR